MKRLPSPSSASTQMQNVPTKHSTDKSQKESQILPNLSISGVIAISNLYNPSASGLIENKRTSRISQKSTTQSRQSQSSQPAFASLPPINDGFQANTTDYEQIDYDTKSTFTSPEIPSSIPSKPKQKKRIQSQRNFFSNQNNNLAESNQSEVMDQGDTEPINESGLSRSGISVASTTPSKSTNSLLSRQYGRYQKRPTKQQAMQEFIKQTLEKTRISTNETPVFSGWNNYVPQEVKAKTSPIAMQSKPLRMIEEEIPKSEYGNVQSRVKQDISDQRKKVESQIASYFSTGKQSYPKYKPPEKVAIDPIQQRKEKMQNFLKKAQGSLSNKPANSIGNNSNISNNSSVKYIISNSRDVSPNIISDDSQFHLPSAKLHSSQLTSKSQIRFKKVKSSKLSTQAIEAEDNEQLLLTNNDNTFESPQTLSHSQKQSSKFVQKREIEVQQYIHEDIQIDDYNIKYQNNSFTPKQAGQPRQLTKEELIKQKATKNFKKIQKSNSNISYEVASGSGLHTKMFEKDSHEHSIIQEDIKEQDESIFIQEQPETIFNNKEKSAEIVQENSTQFHSLRRQSIKTSKLSQYNQKTNEDFPIQNDFTLYDQSSLNDQQYQQQKQKKKQKKKVNLPQQIIQENIGDDYLKYEQEHQQFVKSQQFNEKDQLDETEQQNKKQIKRQFHNPINNNEQKDIILPLIENKQNEPQINS